MANIYSGILSGTMDAFASVISNNLNIVMKFLATITIVMSIPTMVASFYGMNVNSLGMPFADNPHGFIIVLGLTLALTLIVAWIFFLKRICFSFSREEETPWGYTFMPKSHGQKRGKHEVFFIILNTDSESMRFRI